MASYDYIVVGAGSAGCALSYRLVRNSAARVLLIEAGGRDDLPEIHDERLPATMSLWSNPAVNWGYVTAPQPAMDDRTIPVARGRVWGGSSSINAMLHVRGSPTDFDHWNYLGNEGWSYADVLPLFIQMENFAGWTPKQGEEHQGEPGEQRGRGGPLPVIVHADPTPVSECFFAAASELGFEDRGRQFDYNGPRQTDSPFYYQTNKTAAHQRASEALAYLYPILNAPNFTLRSETQVTRIQFSGSRAVGVECLQNGTVDTVSAEKEIIIAGGTYESPKLLMLSGIGPAASLRSHGIPVLTDLPGVGQNLQDHMILGVCYRSKQEHPFVPTLIAETGLFTRSRPGLARAAPDLQIKCGGVKFIAPELDREGPGFTFAPVIIQPQSVGYVTLSGSEPRALATVQPNYLTADTDMQVFLHGIELARALAWSRAFTDFTQEELAPGPAVKSAAEKRAFIRRYASTLWHPVGTCRMGRDLMAVVDPQLRVHGAEGLRVADASVMPRIVAGNTNAACVMIGEKAANLILAS